jgi:mercuric ion binding protein
MGGGEFLGLGEVCLSFYLQRAGPLPAPSIASCAPMHRLFGACATLMLVLAAMAAGQQTAVLDVQNMTCGLCPITVKKALERVPGVADAKVDFDRRTATVRFDADKVNTAALVKATIEAGFPSAARK